MINNTSHIIKRQVLEVSLHQKKDVTHIQDRLSEVYNQKIIPLLDKMFSMLVPGEELVSIDQLDVDIGKLSMRNLEEDFYRIVKSRLEEEFTKIVYKVNQGISQPNVKLIAPAIPTELPANQKQAESFAALLTYF